MNKTVSGFTLVELVGRNGSKRNTGRWRASGRLAVSVGSLSLTVQAESGYVLTP